MTELLRRKTFVESLLSCLSRGAYRRQSHTNTNPYEDTLVVFMNEHKTKTTTIRQRDSTLVRLHLCHQTPQVTDANRWEILCLHNTQATTYLDDVIFLPSLVAAGRGTPAPPSCRLASPSPGMGVFGRVWFVAPLQRRGQVAGSGAGKDCGALIYSINRFPQTTWTTGWAPTLISTTDSQRPDSVHTLQQQQLCHIVASRIGTAATQEQSLEMNGSG